MDAQERRVAVVIFFQSNPDLLIEASKYQNQLRSDTEPALSEQVLLTNASEPQQLQMLRPTFDFSTKRDVDYRKLDREARLLTKKQSGANLRQRLGKKHLKRIESAYSVNSASAGDLKLIREAIQKPAYRGPSPHRNAAAQARATPPFLQKMLAVYETAGPLAPTGAYDSFPRAEPIKARMELQNELMKQRTESSFTPMSQKPSS